MTPGPIATAGATAAVWSSSPGTPAHGAAAPIAGGFSILERLHAVHPHVGDTSGQLMRLVIGGVILHGGRIEHHDVCKVSLLQSASIGQRQIFRRKCAEFAYGFFEGDDVLVAHVLREYAGEVSVGARMLG